MIPAAPTNSPTAVVIGAGPAGSMAAFLLARRGIDTLLVERARFPRPKVCGGCLAQSGYRMLESVGLHTIPALANTGRVQALKLTGAGKELTLNVPPYRVVDRAAFDRQLADRAVGAGAAIVDETTARVLPGGRVELQTHGGPARTLEPRVVIVADGLKGASLRDHPGFAWRVAPSAHVGIGAIAGHRPASCQAGAISMHHAPYGYMGLAPLDGGRAIIAAAVSPRWISDHSDSPPLIALARSLGVDLDPGIPLTGTRGAPALTRARERIEAGGRVFLIGDATGYVEPFTGEGMSWSLEDAVRVASHARAAIDNRYTVGSWTCQHTRSNRRRRCLCHATARLLRRPRLAAGAMSICARRPACAVALQSMIRTLQHGRPPGIEGA
ncbi:MAG: NAD(P)/FAD-dependent oxidoreductase [Phycisphaerales bacterium]